MATTCATSHSEFSHSLEKNAAVISSPASRVVVLVVPTDEELVIAYETLSCLNG